MNMHFQRVTYYCCNTQFLTNYIKQFKIGAICKIKLQTYGFCKFKETALIHLKENSFLFYFNIFTMSLSIEIQCIFSLMI